MQFQNRTEAGQLLAQRLKKYQGQDVVVYALPRGGIETAIEIARYLYAPMDLIITRKIGHPFAPEYAIAAISENGQMIGNRKELIQVDENWIAEAVEKERLETVRRRKKYQHGRRRISPSGKIAILVDDGVATGLTIRAGIRELKQNNPKKIIVAVPIIPKSAAAIISSEVDEVVSLDLPADDIFLGAVGAYYENFPQVEDQEVVNILNSHEEWLKEQYYPKIFTIRSGKMGHDIIDYDEP